MTYIVTTEEEIETVRIIESGKLHPSFAYLVRHAKRFPLSSGRSFLPKRIEKRAQLFIKEHARGRRGLVSDQRKRKWKEEARCECLKAVQFAVLCNPATVPKHILHPMTIGLQGRDPRKFQLSFWSDGPMIFCQDDQGLDLPRCCAIVRLDMKEVSDGPNQSSNVQL